MSSVVLQGDTSGAITLTVPAIAGTNTVSIPAGTGTVAVQGVSTNIVSGTAVASTSGTAIDFTGIPSWVKRITVMFNGVSTNSTSGVRFRLGSSGTAQTTGYNSVYFVTTTTGASNGGAVTAGFDVGSILASGTLYGQVVFCLLSSNTWTGFGSFSNIGDTRTNTVQGAVALSGTLDIVRITTVNGTDAFDAGSINILYE